ncbi:hypothetical protein JCM9279_005445 [Rhodotorula babjevae]
MADDDNPSFDSDAAALAHYRDRCRSLQSQLANAEQDILDFTESSKELQAELEQELERVEQAEKSLRRDLDDAKNQADDWKTKYTTALRDHTTTISHMQRELETLRAIEKSLRARVRDMELDNDDLEKSEREKDSSLQDLDTRYNKSLERIALLEEELVTKAQLDEEVQRLKDELREVNEELSFTRTQLATAPPPPAAPSTASTTPVEPESPSPFPSSSALALGEDLPPRRTSSPAPPDSPSPSIDHSDPTPLLSSRIRPSATSTAPALPSTLASPSPSKIARSTSFSAIPSSPAPFRAPLVQGAPSLARSTRTAHLARGGGAGGLTSSPSTPVLSSPSKAAAASRLPQSPARGIPRTDTATMIRDMQQMTTRVRALTNRLDHRRTSVMRGSAIPRIGSPTAASASTAAGVGGGMARSSTMRGLNGAAAAVSMRPPSRLGSTGVDAQRESSRPPSRSSYLRSSLAAPPRPSSRMSHLSASSSRPVSPAPPSSLPSRSPTPTQGLASGSVSGTSTRASTRPGSALGLGRSLGPGGGATQRRSVSGTSGAPPVAGLSRSVHGRSGSAASSTSASGSASASVGGRGMVPASSSSRSGRSTPVVPLGPPPSRRPGSSLSTRSSDSSATTGGTASGAGSKVARRVSGGFGLLGKSMRRSVTQGDEVPPLPTARGS